MVNKCSVVKCRGLYINNTVNMLHHRFPLENKTTLPLWIAFTEREPGWKPTRSSRLCSNHFIKSDYTPDHKKNVLKPSAVPSIKDRVEFPQYRKNITKLKKIQNNKKSKKKIKPNSSSNYDDYDDKNGNNHNEIMQYENIYNSSYQNNNDVCNRKNQCYLLTNNLIESLEPIILILPSSTNFEDLSSSMNKSTCISNYTENTESIVVISPTENHNRSVENTEEQIINSTFNNIMALTLNKPRCTQRIYSLYFQSPKIRRILSQEESINSLNYTDDIDTYNSGTTFFNLIE